MCYNIGMIPIIGLGNPGNEYKKTRHNVGFMVLDAISTTYDWEYDKYLLANKCTIDIDGKPVILIKPETFMNESGKVLDGIKRINPYATNSMIVVHDEIDLPIGTVKINYDRGHGGHNGVRSINQYFGGKDYIRIRVGISKIGENGELYKPNVLGEFDQNDEALLKQSIEKSVEAIKEIIIKGKDVAANLINQK